MELFGSSPAYPFLLATMLTIALLLDLGVSDFSNSEGVDRFSVDFLSVTGDQQHVIDAIRTYPTPHNPSGLGNRTHGGGTHRSGCSWSSVWLRRCSALPAQSAWTAPPGTTHLSPPSAPCKHTNTSLSVQDAQRHANRRVVLWRHSDAGLILKINNKPVGLFDE